MESRLMYIKPKECHKMSPEVLKSVYTRTGVKVDWSKQNFLKLTGRIVDIEKAKLEINEQLKEVDKELPINQSHLDQVTDAFLQEQNHITSHVRLRWLHRLGDDFIKRTENDNNVQIAKEADGVVIKGSQADVQKTNRDILTEVSICHRHFIPAADWIKPFLSDFLEQKHLDFPDLRLDVESMSDHVILGGHPSEGDDVAEALRKKVSEIELKNSPLFVSLPHHQQSRICTEFIERMGKENDVQITKKKKGISVKGEPENRERTKTAILNEVAKREHEFVSAKNWLKSMVMESLSEKQSKFPEITVDIHCVQDQIVLTGHPYEIGIYATMIREAVTDVESKFTCEVITVKKQLLGCVVGTRGNNIKRLQESFKVTVTVPSAESDSCEVKVQGDKEGVRDAVKDIQKMISHRDRNSKTVIRFTSHERDDVKSIVASLRSQYSQVKTEFKPTSAIFTGPLDDVDTLSKLTSEELKIKRRLLSEMKTISVPLTDSQALVLIASRNAFADIQNEVDSKVAITFEKQTPALMIRGNGPPLKECHIKVAKKLQEYKNHCVLDIKIDDSEMGKMIGKEGRNIKSMQSQHCVEIKTGTRGQTNARKNVTIIGKRPEVETARQSLVRRHNAVTVGYQQYQGKGGHLQRHHSVASLSSNFQPIFSHDCEEDDRWSETSSISDCSENQAVLYEWKFPSVGLLDFVKGTEQLLKQFDGLFSSDESALIEESNSSVTVAGQATDTEFWQSTVEAKLQRFFSSFECCEVQFHPKTAVDKTDIDDGKLMVKWQDNSCLVCGVKERVSEKLAEFEIIKNRKRTVAVKFECDKYLISFMRKNLNIEDEGFTDNGHITLQSEHVIFQSEILEVDSSKDWRANCRKDIRGILQKLDCTKLDVPLLHQGHMRKECRHSDEVSVEWCREDSCLVVSGRKDFVCKEVKRLTSLLYDLSHKKKTVTMRYRCDNPEIVAFITENTEQLENLVKHMGPLGSPVLDENTRDTFTVHGDILETQCTAQWEEQCRVKIKQYFLRYKVLKIDVDHSTRGFCMTLAKSGSNVAVRWVENDSSLVIVGIKSLVAATEKSLREMIEEESTRVSLEHEWFSVEVNKEITLIVKAPDSAFQWLEQNKQRRILRDLKYRKSSRGILISGKEGKVQEVKTLIESISVKELSMQKYGVYKFLKETSTSWLIEEIEINRNCVVQIDQLPDTEFGDEIYVQLPKKSIGSITYEIKEGDITKVDVDVIVNTTNKSFSFDGPLSRYVFSEAGEYLRNLISNVDHEIRYSDAGNLKCQNIIHVAIPKTHESMEDLLLKILRRADGMGMKSIALPTIGGGNGGWNNQDIAVAMRNAFEKFEPRACLKKIVVVLYGGSATALYENILKQKQSPPAPALVQQKPGVFASIRRFFSSKAPEPVPEPTIRANPTPITPSKPPRAATGQHAKVTVSADSKENLTKAVEELQAMTDRFIKDFVIDNVAVLRISQTDLTKIEEMAKEHDVRVIVNKKYDAHSITIQGNIDDASKVKDKVQEIMSGISTDLPKNWIASDKKMIPVKLDNHGAEYQDIEKLFHAANKQSGSGFFSVERIDRIQNLSLYRQYQSKKEEISKRKTPPARIEMRLFHGTDKDTVEAICKHGFNRSYAGKNATVYGKGTYFSTESSYSNAYARKDIHGRQRMFVAEVLTDRAASQLLYADEFDGTSLNTNEWHIDVWPQAHNNELQYYTDRTENIKVENGHLTITPIAENYGGKGYTSGRINSNFAWKYGRVDVRAKLPLGYGLWPAIWMMPRDSVYGGWPESGEIDICEARGENPDEIASTIHFGDTPCCDYHYYESSGDLKIAGSIGEYHVYSLDWTPTALVYRLDGVPYYTQNLDRVISWMYSEKGQPFNQYFHLILNIAVGGHYVNDPTPQTSWSYPQAEMWVDYVRVYDLGYISESMCAPTAESQYIDVCNGVLWACGGDNTYADVSSECTSELWDCCTNTQCTLMRVKELATDVFNSYDEQVNSADSCDFGGAAEKQDVLIDGYAPFPQCLIKDNADPAAICGSMGWACGPDNVYADVQEECAAASDVTACCSADPYSCDQFRLREGAGSVFQAYYDAIPSASSCDFGGVCYLEGISQPIKCQDGYGA